MHILVFLFGREEGSGSNIVSKAKEKMSIFLVVVPGQEDESDDDNDGDTPVLFG
jgi:hypothetical protein